MQRKKKILITGANGFIGSHLIKSLSLTEPYLVWGLVRKTSNLFRLTHGRYELLYGSLNTPLERTVEGFNAVIHTAALSSDWGDKEDFFKTNVDGTLNLLEACVRTGVERFIYLSSTVVYGFSGNLQTVEEKESQPFSNSYCITKTIAEEKIQERAGEIDLVVLRPSNVYGPTDLQFTYSLLKGIDKGLIGFPGGGKALTSPCYVKNLVHAVERTLEFLGHSGEVFNISDGQDIRWSEFLTLIAEEMGRLPPRFSFPVGPLTLFAVVLEALYKMLRSKRPPLITPYRIAQAAQNYSFSIEKAKCLLSYRPPYSTQDGVRESTAWYMQYVHKKKPVCVNRPFRGSP
ncbi:MAG: hypothetical protein AMS17_00065 [Spirochaetes bacterium DG_61]|jgi:nucleoside-diphosphate-sugar epimerase|nr:MAG: hypothetical protein AMS17_00065 [Spirochaetes bacterium DG_61]